MPSFSAIAVLVHRSRWKRRWTSAQSCTSYTLPPPDRGDPRVDRLLAVVVDRAVFDRRYVLSIQAASTRGVTPGTRELARVLAESSRAQGVGSRPGQRSDSLAPHLAGCR